MRKISRHNNFDPIIDDLNPKYIKIDNGSLLIKEKIGEGSFCKVKNADLKVF
jgi:hypothetical protein